MLNVFLNLSPPFVQTFVFCFFWLCVLMTQPLSEPDPNEIDDID